MGSSDSSSPGALGSSSTEAGSLPSGSSDESDDYFHFNVSGSPALSVTSGLLGGSHGDWGGRTADVGPFRLKSHATGKYGAFSKWPRDHSLVNTMDKASKAEATMFTLVPDGWGTVRIKESVTGRCLRVYETSLFRQRGPLTACEGEKNDRSQEEVRWVLIPAQPSNAPAASQGGFILVNYRNAKCLNLAGREEYSAGKDVHLDSGCNGERASATQTYTLEGETDAETDSIRAAATQLAVTYGSRNCADGSAGAKLQYDCMFTPASANAWSDAVEQPEAVCVAPAEVNNTGAAISKELTVNENSGWTVKVGREYSASSSLEPKLLASLGLKVTAGLKLTRDQTWTGALSQGTKLTLQTPPGYTSWVSRELRVREVEGSWSFGVGRLPWTSAQGPVRVPVKDAYQLVYNSAYFTSANPFSGCATRNPVDPLTRPYLTQSGDVLTVSPGAWPTSDWTLGYRWFKQRGGAREMISTSDSPSYTRTSTDDRNTPIGVIVTAYRQGYAPTETVIDAEPPA